MTDKQWKVWEERNKAALLYLHGQKGVDKRLAKLKEKAKRNAARIESCKLHNFDWRKCIKDAQERREKWGVCLPLPPTIKAEQYCRCKNCGGKMPIMYAAPYMEAVEHIEKMKKEGEV